jgi:hypothetical protein
MPVIHIDTSDLSYGWFWVPGHLPHFVDGSRPGGAAVSLPPGEYAFQQTRSRASDLWFRVTEDGLVDHDDATAGLVRGRGTDTLRVLGVPVTLHAPGPSLELLPLWGGCVHPIVPRVQRLRVVPGSDYEIRLGRVSDRVVAFDVGPDGVVDYDSEHERTLSGRGTDELTVGASS